MGDLRSGQGFLQFGQPRCGDAGLRDVQFLELGQLARCGTAASVSGTPRSSSRPRLPIVVSGARPSSEIFTSRKIKVRSPLKFADRLHSRVGQGRPHHVQASSGWATPSGAPSPRR